MTFDTPQVRQQRTLSALTNSEKSDVWHWINSFRSKYSSISDISLGGIEDFVFWAIYRKVRDYLNHEISLRVAWNVLWEILISKRLPPEYPD